MKQSWEPSIRALWFSSKTWPPITALVLVISLVAPGAVKKQNHAAAKPAPPKAVGAAGLIAVAQHQLEAGDFAAAAEYADSASAKAPILDDYAQYIRAQAKYKLKDYGESSKAVTRVLGHTPSSPFTGAAAALAVTAELENNGAKSALELIRKYYERIPMPQAELLLARCFQATGDLPQAAEHFQRVYYEYPSSREAAEAATALVSIKAQLADAYPPPMASAMIQRAQKLFDAKNPLGAKVELAAAIPQLGGADRDVARVRLGEADYYAGSDHDAFAYLSALKVDDPEADAERLSYLIRCARKPDRHADVRPFLDQLEQQHANSLWRLDALIFVADQARTENDTATDLPLYRACAGTFSADKRSAWCHWQLAFDSYRHDSADANDLLRAHLETYPDSPDVNDALYFLGRLAERKNQLDVARACYDELNTRFPNTYYAVVARQRLEEIHMKAANPDPKTVQFLAGIHWPARPEFPSFTPGPTEQTRLDRAHLLHLTGLDDMAEGELKYGARVDGEQPNVYALQLASLAAGRNAPDQAMRYIKSLTPGYLFMPLDEAPLQFWRYAFPIPYQDAIERDSHAQSLDPFLVAALIRQESEFNAKVISHANAYGLMQLLPATGKQLARQVRIHGFNAQQLLLPDRNIQLGTMFFHNLLNTYGGQAELALASYNAGPGRAALWKTWGPFREPSEFIEAVPFHETRGYIQIVLRNADVYKRLYANAAPDVPAYHAKPAPKKTVPKRLHRKVA